MRNYLVEQKMDHLFDEHEIQKFLSPYSRRKLIKSLVSFIADEYNGKASQADIKMVCHATIAVFGCLKTDRSAIGGIVSYEFVLLIFIMNEFICLKFSFITKSFDV